MKADYQDIIKKIDMPPSWWDERGVPRYCEPHPESLACIYAEQAIFYYIECQGCAHEFLVASSWWNGMDYEDLETRIKDHNIHYGDPPNYCCDSGATMGSVRKRIHSFWVKDKFEWKEIAEMKGQSLS